MWGAAHHFCGSQSTCCTITVTVSAFGPAACGRDSHLMAAACTPDCVSGAQVQLAIHVALVRAADQVPGPAPPTALSPPWEQVGGPHRQDRGGLGETCLDPKLPCGHRCHAVHYLGFGFRASCERSIKQSKRKLRRGGPGFSFLTRGGCCIRRGHRRSPSEAGQPGRGPSLGVTAAPGYLRAEAPDAPPNRPPG